MRIHRLINSSIYCRTQLSSIALPSLFNDVCDAYLQDTSESLPFSFELFADLIPKIDEAKRQLFCDKFLVDQPERFVKSIKYSRFSSLIKIENNLSPQSLRHLQDVLFNNLNIFAVEQDDVFRLMERYPDAAHQQDLINWITAKNERFEHIIRNASTFDQLQTIITDRALKEEFSNNAKKLPAFKAMQDAHQAQIQEEQRKKIEQEKEREALELSRQAKIKQHENEMAERELAKTIWQPINQKLEQMESMPEHFMYNSQCKTKAERVEFLSKISKTMNSSLIESLLITAARHSPGPYYLDIDKVYEDYFVNHPDELEELLLETSGPNIFFYANKFLKLLKHDFNEARAEEAHQFFRKIIIKHPEKFKNLLGYKTYFSDLEGFLTNSDPTKQITVNPNQHNEKGFSDSFSSLFKRPNPYDSQHDPNEVFDMSLLNEPNGPSEEQTSRFANLALLLSLNNKTDANETDDDDTNNNIVTEFDVAYSRKLT